MKIRKYLFQALFVLAGTGIVFCLYCGCGKEGKPLPPLEKADFLPAPFALRADIVHGEKTTLEWQYPDDPKTRARVREFHVFAAPVRPEDCRDCPVTFTKIATVSMPKMRFVMEIPDKIDYRVKIRAVGVHGSNCSGYSNTITLTR